MGYVIGLMYLLALGVMGCGETTCPEGGGEPVADCALVEEEVECVSDCVDDPDRRTGCELEFNRCIDQGQSVTSCVIAAANICGGVEIP